MKIFTYNCFPYITQRFTTNQTLFPSLIGNRSMCPLVITHLYLSSLLLLLLLLLQLFAKTRKESGPIIIVHIFLPLFPLNSVSVHILSIFCRKHPLFDHHHHSTCKNKKEYNCTSIVQCF